MVRHGEVIGLLDDADSDDGAARLELFASALCGRPLRVGFGEPGEPAWTDGSVVYVDGGADAREQRIAIAVQAALLAAGSLERDIARQLKRRPKLARRYLAIEAHRALGAMADVLPSAVRSVIDSSVASSVASPAESLAAARRADIADPHACFGTIRPRRLLAAQAAEQSVVVRRDTELIELDGDEVEEVDLFSSPVGGAGALGRLLGSLMTAVRRLEGGSPGADAPTHWTGAAPRGESVVTSSRAAALPRDADVDDNGAKYPEWDRDRRRYRKDWCTVREIEPQPKDAAALAIPRDYQLRRSLARLGTGLDRCRRRIEGDEVDIDAVVEARIEAMRGATASEAIYVESLRRRRDLAVLLLLDVSGSAGEATAAGRTVHEQQRTTAAALTAALHDLGIRVALYAYRSRGRSDVHVLPVKRFEESVDAIALARLRSLEPGAYSRLGAAVRHGARVLAERGGTSRRLLVVLSDGLAYDHGYELAYGAADARRALAEARRRGTACLCLSIGAGTDVESLGRVFGSAAHAAIPRPEQLGRVIGPLFRAALRSAEVPRQMERRA